LTRNQSPTPIKKYMEENQQNVQLNRTKYPPIRQRTLHIHQKPGAATTVVIKDGRQKVSMKSDLPDVQCQVGKDKGRQLQNDRKKKMHQSKPRVGRHIKRRY
jgi:hypothetical protein